jgi:hypothetical protein
LGAFPLDFGIFVDKGMIERTFVPAKSHEWKTGRSQIVDPRVLLAGAHDNEPVHPATLHVMLVSLQFPISGWVSRNEYIVTEQRGFIADAGDEFAEEGA